MPQEKIDGYLKDMLNKCKRIQPEYMPITEVAELCRNMNLISTEQEREHYDRSMLCLDENGLIGTVDSIPQAIRYAGCVASQKDYLAGVVTMGRVLTRLKDQDQQDTLDYANVCETLAFCLMMMGEIDTGFNHYKNCLAIYEKIYAEEPDIIEAKKNQIQQNCAKIGIYLGKRLRGDI